MASPNTSWTDILTTTLYARQKTMADNILTNNALLTYLKKGDRRRPVSGGVSILEHLEYATSTNFARISGYEAFPIAAQELFTAAEFAPKEAVTAITISQREMAQNAGDAQMLDLLESRVKNGEKTLLNNIASDCYADGTASASKQIGGLQLLVADAPTTGTVGGIDRASYTFWRNYYLGASVSGSGASITAGNIQANMNTVLSNVTRGRDRTSVILMDNLFYTRFMGSLQTIQRVTDVETGEAGFQKLRYAGIDVVMDGGYGGACPASHAYFLNVDYISYRPYADYEFVPLDPDRFATNQAALVKVLYWMGNMTLSNAFLQGVLIN